MEIWYSISNRDFTIYNKHGICVAVIGNGAKIEDLVEKYKVADSDVHVSF